ncbi:MAG: hypothetical protein ACLTNE_03675 [Intestinimonas butyriciproducens]|uniref:hypothetical protein n=1 Tax=Intestinimonas butyriciproducens TaxID=1297617 RepID=UPI003991403C
MPEESINIYMSLVDKVSGPLSGIFRGVRAYSTGYAPNPQRDRWKREDRRSRDQNERKKAAPKGGGNGASHVYAKDASRSLSSVDHKQGETQPQHEEAKPDEDIDPCSRVLIRMKATYSKI